MGGGACSSHNPGTYSELDVCDLTVDKSVTIRNAAPHEDDDNINTDDYYGEQRVSEKYMSTAEEYEKVDFVVRGGGAEDNRPIVFLAFEGGGGNIGNANGKGLKWLNLFVRTVDIGDSAVTNRKIAINAVKTDQIENDAVTTDKIANGAVTEDKLNSDIVLFEIQGDSNVEKQEVKLGEALNIYYTPYHVTRVPSYNSNIHKHEKFNFPLDGFIHDFTTEGGNNCYHSHKTIHPSSLITKINGTNTINDLRLILDFDMHLNAPGRHTNNDHDPILVRPVFRFEMDYDTTSNPVYTTSHYYYDKHTKKFVDVAEINGDAYPWAPEKTPYWYKFYGEYESRYHTHKWTRSNFHYSLREIFKFNSDDFKTNFISTLKAVDGTDHWTGNIRIKLQFVDALGSYNADKCYIDDVRIETKDVTEAGISVTVSQEPLP